VWAYPYVGGTVYRYSPTVAKFGSHVLELKNRNSLSGGEVGTFAEDDDGSIWIATGYSGLNQFEPRSGRFAGDLTGMIREILSS
jgi:Two component regulator propeller